MTEELKNGAIGSSREDFLKREGIYEECRTKAVKEVLACIHDSCFDLYAPCIVVGHLACWLTRFLGDGRQALSFGKRQKF